MFDDVSGKIGEDVVGSCSSAPKPRKKPGPKPGQRHSGQFVKGDPRCGRPGVSREFVKNLTEAAKSMAPDALEALRSILADPKGKPQDRLAAAKEVLNRAMGQPVSASYHLTEERGIADSRPPRALTDDDLLRVLAVESSSNVIEGEFSSDLSFPTDKAQ